MIEFVLIKLFLNPSIPFLKRDMFTPSVLTENSRQR